MQTLNLGNLALVLRGDWQEEEAYRKNDVVRYDGGIWGARQSISPGQAPGVGEAWMMLLNGVQLPVLTPADKGKVLTVLPDGTLAWLQTNYVGEIRLMPFRATELPAGWYFANGDRYSLNSPQGQALNSLSANYKTDWRITLAGTDPNQTINLPKMFHTDGRAFFLRPGSGNPGEIVGDAIRNFSGECYSVAGFTACGGITSQEDGGCVPIGPNWMSTDELWGFDRRLRIDASYQVPTAGENRPLHVTMTPAIYLGV